MQSKILAVSNNQGGRGAERPLYDLMAVIAGFCRKVRSKPVRRTALTTCVGCSHIPDIGSWSSICHFAIWVIISHSYTLGLLRLSFQPNLYLICVSFSKIHCRLHGSLCALLKCHRRIRVNNESVSTFTRWRRKRFQRGYLSILLRMRQLNISTKLHPCCIVFSMLTAGATSEECCDKANHNHVTNHHQPL